MEIKTFTTMEYGELEQLAKDTFGINYEYVCEEELSNDSNYSYRIDEDDVTNFDWKEWAEFLEGKRGWRVRLLLTRLAMLKKIPMGELLIEVSW